MFKLFFNLVGRVTGAVVNFIDSHLYAKGEELTTTHKIVHTLFSASLMVLSIIGGYTHKLRKGLSIALSIFFALDTEAQFFAKAEV